MHSNRSGLTNPHQQRLRIGSAASVLSPAFEPSTICALASHWSTFYGLLFVTSYNMKTNTEVAGLPTYPELLVRHDADATGDLTRAEIEANASVLSRFDADGEGDHPLRIFFRWLDEDRDGLLAAAEYEKLLGWVAGFEHRNALLAI